MNHLYESVSYLRGLAEGMEIEDSKKGKLLLAIIDVLDDLAESINDLSDDLNEIDDYIEAIDEDLADLEDDFYEDEDGFEDEDEEFEDEDLDYDEVVCPECGEVILIDDPGIDEGAFETTITCPTCETVMEVITEDADEDDADMAADDQEETPTVNE